MLKNIFLCIFMVHIFSGLLCQNNEVDYKINKTAIAENGMVVSAHPLASKIGVMVMKKGGNAVDAIIATQLALAVVYPVAGNIGGGGFLIIHFANDTTKVFDFREVAPGLATQDMYLENGIVVKDLSRKGHLAAGVPGTIAGIFAAYKYAKLPFEDLIQPAIDLAIKGFRISKREAKMLNLFSRHIEKYSTQETAFIKEHKGGEKTNWIEGDLLIQKKLGNTLIRIKEKGEQEFYTGKTADLIVAEMKRGKGIITKEDLKNYKVSERIPFVFNYRNDYTIITMPPPSSGGLVLNQALKMIESNPIDDYHFQSSNTMNLMIEVERRAYADRNKYLGDPSFIKMPLTQLTDSIYLKDRMANFVLGQSGSSDKIQAGVVAEKLETTHLTSVDKDRNVCVVTTTLNGNYGNQVVVGGAGFLLNNEMDDFTTKLGAENMYHSVGEEQNLIAPGKKMLSSMTPTIVLKKGKFYFSVGSPGGTTIPTSVLQTIINIIDFNKSTEEAVQAPRFHHQWLPDSVSVESNLSLQAKDELKHLGYKLKEVSTIGRVEVIKILDDNKLEGVADIRGDDHAEGY